MPEERPSRSARTRTALRCADVGESWAGIPGIARTPRGRLFLCFYSGGDREPDPRNRVYLCHSDDDGESFTPPAILADPPADTRAFDPTLWLDPQNRLWLIYCTGNRRIPEHRILIRRCDDPDAECPRWSEPRPVDLDVPFAFRLNKPTVLANGRYLMPVTWQPRIDRSQWLGRENLQGAAISDDRGAAWRLAGAVEAPAWALENMFVQRTDHTVVMFIRTGAGRIWQSLSRDAGETWSEAEPTDIVDPGSRFFVAALDSGNWLLIHSPLPDRRQRLVARRSADQGRTWSQPLTLDERPAVSYPDAVEGPPGELWAVHDHDRRGQGLILLSQFREADIPDPERQPAT